MRRALITLGAVALIITFGALKNTWAGFKYFALVFSCLICLYWIVILSIEYHFTYTKFDEERYRVYVAKLVNYKNIPIEQIEMADKFYKKKFKRSLWKEKLLELGKILFLVGIVVGCVFVFIY